MTITSRENKWIRELRKLGSAHRRSRSRLFFAEGEDLIDAAAEAGWVPAAVLVSEGSGRAGTQVAAELLDSVSRLGSGTRAIGIYKRPEEDTVQAGLILHLSGVRDPGNVGTAVRSAHAFGASCVTLSCGSADPYGPKAVRASMGSIFALPVVEDVSLAELPGTKVGLDAGGTEGELPAGDLVLALGSERGGLAQAELDACDRLWRIPMAVGVDSLNAGVAASLALHAANRMGD